VTDQTDKPTSPQSDLPVDPTSNLRSPIRPVHPETEDATKPTPVKSGMIAKAAQLSTEKAIADADNAPQDKMPENPQAA